MHLFYDDSDHIFHMKMLRKFLIYCYFIDDTTIIVLT